MEIERRDEDKQAVLLTLLESGIGAGGGAAFPGMV